MPARPQSASEPGWFKSSYSGGNTTECLECANLANGVLIRDSKNPWGPALAIGSRAWRSFVSAVSR
ncbi:predicted protein [Streptomyces viridochromogenes DSM 40736]|uniref:Predicted protein n=1 Tax=Streptomyces viridochromogenes (strain DSM 40736 / JCM 4977 / BCRC 1201 / Tue 494) TaxID=591159 RepID=D9XCF0_STRVT|nr:DUF397 domain-containing protein [Streptomyces viridochromogenes]EFL32407.1 predicted protein [Streptomyces viridochromogenes DSM 40736]